MTLKNNTRVFLFSRQQAPFTASEGFSRWQLKLMRLCSQIHAFGPQMGAELPDILPLKEVTHFLILFKKKTMQHNAFMAYFRVGDSPSFTKPSH